MSVKLSLTISHVFGWVCSRAMGFSWLVAQVKCIAMLREQFEGQDTSMDVQADAVNSWDGVR